MRETYQVIEQLKQLMKTEPTRLFGVLRVVIATSVVVGLHLTVEQKAAWLSIIAAVEALFTSKNRGAVVSQQTVEDAGHTVKSLTDDAAAARDAGTV